MQVSDDSARIGFPPPFIYLGLLLLGLALDRWLPWTMAVDVTALLAAAVILVATGAALLLAASGLFRRRGTEVRPWLPTAVLVDAGPYAFTRNPMYLGMALIYLGVGMAFASVGTLILLLPLVAIIQTQVIAREERYLAAKFGDSYRAYCRRVRRWL